jgi:hypothetical protein
MRKKDAPKKMLNLLHLKPVHNRRFEQAEDGRVAILQPRISNRVLKQWFDPILRNPDIRIRLDDYGSYVWKQCTGECTVGEIADRLREKFGSSIEPVMDRLELFLKYLERYEFIRYINVPELQCEGQ